MCFQMSSCLLEKKKGQIVFVYKCEVMPKFWNKFVKNLELRVKDKWIKNDVLKRSLSVFVIVT